MGLRTLSIIIPCYNGWKYFEKCLQSLEKQARFFDELIIVDDCSSDNTVEQLKNYARLSGLNIKLIVNNKNLGPGRSRENGLAYATGEYVAFCDCDDWYEIDFSKIIKDVLEKIEADLIIYDTYTAFDFCKKTVDHITTNLIGKNKKYLLAHYPMSLCRMVIKKSLLIKATHTDLRHAEDGVVVAQLIAQAKKIHILDKPLYNYYFRDNSASKKPGLNTSIELLEAYKLINTLLDKDYAKEIEYIGINYVCYGAILCGLKAGVDYKQLTIILDEFEKNCPQWESNTYKSELGLIKNLFLYFVKKRQFIILSVLARMHPYLSKLKRK